MSFKKLFINGDEKPEDKPKTQDVSTSQKQTNVSFPSSKPDETPQTSSFTNLFGFGNNPQPVQTSVPNNIGVKQEDLNKAIQLYENGFDSLNQSGYDFYEFFKSVVQAGIDNPQIYPMAFTMGSAMDKTITKDKLLQQSDFYLGEINKVYNDYVNKGNSRKQELNNQKNHENQALIGELDLMNQQLEALKTQIQDRQNKLNAIDTKYGPMISDVDSKLMANESAKNQIVQRIEQVKNGIINNIK